MTLGTRAIAPLETFRDPAGRVEVQQDIVLRYVQPHAREDAELLLQAPFYLRNQAAGHIVSSVVRDSPCGEVLVLEHPRILFPSYCWEWTPSQWLAAGELTLRLCEEALADGWILKDATPLNVLFEGPKPVFVDVLSFERVNPRSAIWKAQAQFIRTFLLPLIARKWLGWPLATSLIRRDGITPEELMPVMPKRSYLSSAVLWNIVLPTTIERRTNVSATKIDAAQARENDPEVAGVLLRRTLRSMRKQLRKAEGGVGDSHWSKYQKSLTHYEATDVAEKKAFVAACLEATHPAAVLDIGSNTGTYSLLAARHGARVLAIDSDETSADHLARQAALAGVDVQALVVNLGRPTPSLGWTCQEQMGFLDRAVGRFDLVLMLAVIHHLLLTEQVPLRHIASLAAGLTRQWLVLEWVPATDPMFLQLLRGRGDLYNHLDEGELLAAFLEHFRVDRRQPLANGRILFLFERLA